MKNNKTTGSEIAINVIYVTKIRRIIFCNYKFPAYDES